MTRVTGKFFNQILHEVLMNCTTHFDLSSSLTASCVAKLTMCRVCQLNFSGLVCSVLSLDECLIKITLTLDDFVWLLGSFCHLMWHHVRLICNVKRCFYWITIFLWKMAEFSLWWFGGSQFHGKHRGVVLLYRVFRC